MGCVLAIWWLSEKLGVPQRQWGDDLGIIKWDPIFQWDPQKNDLNMLHW